MDFGELMRTELSRHGWSLSAAAEEMYRDKGHLSRVQNGRQDPSPQLAADLDALLGTTVFAEALAGPPVVGDRVLRLAHEWLVDDGSPVVRHRAAGRRVGASLVEELSERVIELRLADDTVPSRRLAPVIGAELEATRAVLREGAYPERVGQGLLRLFAELAQLAGWTVSDLGSLGRAERLYLSGVEAAREAGDRPLVAQLLSCIAYQVSSRGGDGLLLARSAVRGADGAPPLVRALLLERLAWAAARSGDAEAAYRALDAVDDAYDARGGQAEPHWTYWLDRSEIDVMAGRCLIELDQPDQAAPMLERAIATYPPDHVREVVLYLTWLAEGYARGGNRDAAAATLLRAERLGAESDRIAQRLGEVGELVTAAP